VRSVCYTIQAGQTDQMGWHCGWPEAGLTGDGGREKDYGQTTGRYRKCQSPSAHRLQRTWSVTDCSFPRAGPIDSETPSDCTTPLWGGGGVSGDRGWEH